ncbi:MAG: heavy-metal-associated domain-containing protein, partial [Candidatus Solibacter usitatus]|nr:heavy-metal-associated domain-containing protein [Candidatus Solibacter usitatus]
MRIEGMTCDGCARHVAKALQGVAGVEQAQVGSWRSGEAIAIADAGVDAETLARAVEGAGYR